MASAERAVLDMTTRSALSRTEAGDVGGRPHLTQVGSHATSDHAATGLGRNDPKSRAVELRCWPLFEVSACEAPCGNDRTASPGQVSQVSALVAGKALIDYLPGQEGDGQGGTPIRSAASVGQDVRLGRTRLESMPDRLPGR
jgi:hypothetical protein